MQYPHFLFVKTSTESAQDENGAWMKPTSEWIMHSVCREQPNSKNSHINVEDGRSITFTSVIHLPIGASRISSGTPVMVKESNDISSESRTERQCLKFDKGQLHCRLWV